jgi:WhiB family transcriptional regulator, redox-sensing transcriptional regulator
MDDFTWQREAACKGKAELFFPAESVGHLTPARKLCAECPVREPCFEYGLELVDHKKTRDAINRGIWGGYSTDELKDLIAGRNSGALTDHECEHPNCTAKTPWAANKKAPARYCSTRCLKRASARNKHIRSKMAETLAKDAITG